MKCAKCNKLAVSLYGIPVDTDGRFMRDPRAPKWCYNCWVQDYGGEEEFAEWIEDHKSDLDIDRAIEADAFPNK